jgi:hypothetical protein
MFSGIIDYATSYATLLLHNEPEKSHFDNELISSIPRHLGCDQKPKTARFWRRIYYNNGDGIDDV